MTRSTTPVERVALVTGAARGIGAATVCGLAAAGWAVVAVDRAADDPRLPYPLATESELEATVRRALGEAAGTELAPRVIGRVADTTDGTALAAVVDEAEQRFGGLDAVVAVAGVIAGGVPLWEMPADQLGAVLGVDLGGPVTAARVGIPALLRRPEPRAGRFLAVSSVAGMRGLPMLAAYGAAKAGVIGLVKGLAAELAGTGVTANAVAPGSTDTPLLVESARLYRMADHRSFAEQQALHRLIEPSEVADVIVWLAGAGGAAMTGAVVPVDGGLSL
jgi:SDR family mycofactocin-dependent oxidoreductase